MEVKCLTQDQIEFIKQALIRYDVIYDDVRAEMIDHIASAVEQKMQLENLDFWDAYRLYMIDNKKELLKNNNKPYLYYWNSIKSFAKTLYQPVNLIFGLLLLTLYYFFKPLIDLKNIYYWYFYFPIIFLLINTLIFRLLEKKNYLYVENLALNLMFIYFFNLFVNGFATHFIGTCYTLGISVYLFNAFVIHYISTIKKHRQP